MRRLLRALGDTRVTFWSLVVAAALFFAGAFHSNARFELFSTLNETRIQDWLADRFPANLAAAWWLPPLLLALLALGINTAACTADRIATLWPTRRGRSAPAFLRDLTPSVIHALFAAVMFGHLLTVTAGEWHRFPLRERGRIELPGAGTLAVEGLRTDLAPPARGGERRISGVEAVLAADSGETLRVAFGAPASYRGFHLLLDRPKKPKKKAPETGADESCNREKDFRVGTSGDRGVTWLVAVKDPGLVLIFPAFALILVLMGWYFAAGITGRGRGS